MVDQNKSKESLLVTTFNQGAINQKLASIGRRLSALEGVGQQTVRLGTKIRGVSQDATKITDLMRKDELLVDGDSGNLVMLGPDGELLDSGYSPSDLLGDTGDIVSAARGYRATTIQLIPPSVWTKVQFNAEEYDLLGEFSPDGNVWIQKAAQLGAVTAIYYLCVFNNELYGGTNISGQLYKWTGTAWVSVAPQLGAATQIWDLKVFNSKLYGATNIGVLYEWNGTNAWVSVAPVLLAQTFIYSLCVFGNKLYGGTSPNGMLFEWNGVNAWMQKAPQLGAETIIYSLAVFNAKLYGGTSPNGNLYEWNGVNLWVQRAPLLAAETRINCLLVYRENLYGGTVPNANLYQWNGVNLWVQMAPSLMGEEYIFRMVEFDGAIYGGTLAHARLYRWNGTNAWIEKAQQLDTETQILGLAVFNGKIYGGTGTLAGKLFEYTGGDSCFTAQEEGKYSIKSIIKLNATNILDARQVWAGVFVNDVLVATSIFHTSHVGVITADIMADVALTQGSTADIRLYHTMTSQVEVAYGNDVTHMEVHKI